MNEFRPHKTVVTCLHCTVDAVIATAAAADDEFKPLSNV